MKYVFKHGKRKGGNPTMEPLVPQQTPIVGVPGIPVNTNVTLEDRNQEINNPDFKNLQVNMTIPQSPPPVNPTAASTPITLEDLAKEKNPVVTPQDIANGAIVVDGGTGTTKTATNNNVNVNGGNIMNNQQMNQQQMNMNQQQMNQQYYQGQVIPQQQMPMPQQPEEGGFFSSPTVKMVGVGVACAAAGYLGHKYMSASDSAEVAAALGELL